MAQAVVQSSCRKLRSAIGDEATKHLKFTGDMQEMLEQLEAIHAVIPNADKYRWIVKDKERGKYPLTELGWLTNVKATAYMICHMVDEMQDMSTPAARDKMANVEVEIKSEEMLDKIKKIKEKLKELQKESVEFDAQNMKALVQAQEAGVRGREKDIDRILAQLSACPTSKGPITLLIHGFVGVGKATMATIVFEHDRFKRYSRIWINHSNMLDLCEIGKYIISQLSPGEKEKTSHGSSSNDNFNHITNQLHSVLNGKKVLLVLHDLWKEDEQWKGLKEMLSVGGTGIGSTQVIVIATVNTCRKDTSNNTQVMETQKKYKQHYCLNTLSNEMCCNIIKEAAVRSQDHRSADKEDLGIIATEIAKLCKGIPLAAQLFGSVLKFKKYAEWPELLDFQAFSTSSSDDSTSSSVDSTSSPVDPVYISLELSYRSMPPNMRLCFAYCAIFSMERIIVKEDLIHQWIALDLIEPSDEFSTTQLAEQYLRRLLDMSLLQTTPWTNAKDDTCAISVTMHGSVRLFAKTCVAEDCCFLDEEGKKCDYIERCSYALVISKHLKEIFSHQKVLRALRCLGCSEINLRNDSFSFVRHLRVLELHKSFMKELPESICELRHLGYLKLSGWSGLVTLPESIRDLTNLVHIDLSGCSSLVNLPDSFGKLTTLEHINLLGCDKLLNLPESFGKLIKLVHVNLSGCLALVNLPESIVKLTHLEHINLSGCLALGKLPDSFGKMTKLEHINLSGCLALEKLPDSFGKLTKLVHINLSGCLALKKLPDFFGKLTKLMHINLSGCLALEKLPGFGNLIRLVHINLSGCLALVNLPGSFGKLTNLKHINLSGCLALVNLPGSFGKLTNLKHINLSGCRALVNLPGSFGKLINLEHVNLSCCSGLKELPQSFGKLISLEHISLSGCSGLVTLPRSLGDLRNLLHIDLSRCYGLQKLPESFGKLKKLVHLDLSFCSCFEEIQKTLCGLTSLQHLNLSHPCCYRADYACLNGLKELLCQFIRLEHLNLSMFLNLIFCNHSEKENSEYMEFISGFSRLEHLDLSHSILLRDVPESLARLNKLQTVDLSGCIRLKKVPEWMAKMPSLKSVVLSNVETYQFVVGIGNENAINSYDQLLDLRCKQLEITCLEEMESVAKARGIRLEEKQNLQKLELCWTVSSQRAVEDNALLGELVPPHSLQSLKLHGYSSTCFPDWLTSSLSSFKLVEVTMEDIPKCSRLPPLGLLQNLERVVLTRMASITKINARELSGGNRDAFNRLSKFTIDDMGSLEEFTCYSGDAGEENLLFPVFDELMVHKCPNLNLVTPPPRAQRLVISDCNDVMDSSWLGSLISLKELVIENCENIISLPPNIGELTNLKDLSILGCEYLKKWCGKNKETLGLIQPKFGKQGVKSATTTTKGSSQGPRRSQRIAQLRQANNVTGATEQQVGRN